MKLQIIGGHQAFQKEEVLVKQLIKTRVATSFSDVHYEQGKDTFFVIVKNKRIIYKTHEMIILLSSKQAVKQ